MWGQRQTPLLNAVEAPGRTAHMWLQKAKIREVNWGRRLEEVRGRVAAGGEYGVEGCGQELAPEGEHQAGKRHGILRKEVLKGRVWG